MLFDKVQDGSYRRLGHVHGDVQSLDTKVDANTSSIIANDNSNRATVVDNDNANRDILYGQAETNTNKLIAKSQMLADQGKSREVENFLRMRECTAWMYTPASLGGDNEFVLEVVAGVVSNARALGSVDAGRLRRPLLQPTPLA